MTEDKKRSLLKEHPIQLEHINVVELNIRANQPPDDSVAIPLEAVNLSHGHTPYNIEDKSIQAGLIIEVGLRESDPETPFCMRVELFGSFIVDEGRFKREHVEDWAKRAAHFILMPYLREHVYALTSRCGFPPFILPTFEVPTFEVVLPKEKIDETSDL